MPEGSTSPARPRVAAAIAIASAVWLCYAGGKHALASHYASSPNFPDWERATRIEPDNPETWYRLGRFRQLDFDNADIPLAISYYQRAVKLYHKRTVLFQCIVFCPPPSFYPTET